MWASRAEERRHELCRWALRMWMEERGRTIRQAAEVFGCSFSTLKHILNEYRRPGIELARRIEEHTGIAANRWGPWPPRNGKGNTKREA